MTQHIKEWKIAEQSASQYEDGCGCVCGIDADKRTYNRRNDPLNSAVSAKRHSAMVNPAS